MDNVHVTVPICIQKYQLNGKKGKRGTIIKGWEIKSEQSERIIIYIYIIKRQA